MAKQIEIPGQGIVEFPDSMSDDQIAQVISRQFPAQKAAEAPGIGQTLMIGAGRTADKIMQGMTQLYGKAIGDESVGRGLAIQEAEKDAIYSQLQKQRPIATGIGEAIPSLAVPIGSATLARAAISGALPRVLSYGSANERLASGAVGAAGGAAGALAARGLTRLLQPASRAASISDDALAAADRLGVNLTAGQRTQNPALINFENYLSRSPGSSGVMQAQRQAQQQAMSRAAAGAMGQRADDLGEGTFAAARNAIGSEFERLQGITRPKLETDFFEALAKIEAGNAAKGSFRSPKIDRVITKGLDLAAKGELTGTAYKQIRTELSNEATKAFKGGDATVGQAYKQIRAALDEAAKKSLPEAEQEAWEVTRKQWQAYKLLTKSNVAEAGELSAPRLAAAVRQQGDALRTGAARGPLADIARLGEAVKGAQNPNSGQLMQQMLYGNPLTGIPMMAGNRALQSMYSSRPMQNYLANGLLDIGPQGQALLTRAAIPVTTPLVGGFFGAQ